MKILIAWFVIQCFFVYADIPNNGQYIIKPLTRFDLRVEFQQGVDKVKGKSVILTPRFDKVAALQQNWTVSLRADLPFEGFYCTPGCEGCYDSNRLGDWLVEGIFITPEYHHWALAFGLRLIFPTAGRNLEIGNGKYRILPTIALGYDLGAWSPGANIALLLRQDCSFAGYQFAPRVNQTYIQPMFNYNLTRDWFISLSPEIRYNWTARTWFVPFDFMIGVMLKEKLVFSVEYEHALVKSYPRYNQQVEFRLGFFY